MAGSEHVESGQAGTLLVEVRQLQISGDLAPRLAAPEDFRRRAAEVADGVADVAEQFRSKLSRVLAQPDDSGWRVGSIEIGFEIAVQAEAGVIIAKATTGATFSARLVLQASKD